MLTQHQKKKITFSLDPKEWELSDLIEHAYNKFYEKYLSNKYTFQIVFDTRVILSKATEPRVKKILLDSFKAEQQKILSDAISMPSGIFKFLLDKILTNTIVDEQLLCKAKVALTIMALDLRYVDTEQFVDLVPIEEFGTC